jgi:hypothetical protein
MLAVRDSGLFPYAGVRLNTELVFALSPLVRVRACEAVKVPAVVVLADAVNAAEVAEPGPTKPAAATPLPAAKTGAVTLNVDAEPVSVPNILKLGLPPSCPVM